MNKKDVTVEALLEVNGERIRTFDKAWHRAMELSPPVYIRFIDFVRKD